MEVHVKATCICKESLVKGGSEKNKCLRSEKVNDIGVQEYEVFV